VLRKYWIRDALARLRDLRQPVAWSCRDRVGSNRPSAACRPGRPRCAVAQTSATRRSGELISPPATCAELQAPLLPESEVRRSACSVYRDAPVAVDPHSSVEHGTEAAGCMATSWPALRQIRLPLINGRDARWRSGV